MGSYQSKVSPEAVLHEKQVLERLRAMNLESSRNSDDDGFVVINEKADSRLAATRDAEGLSASQMQAWQSQLLADPKNRLALTALSSGEPKTVLMSPSPASLDPQVFNVKIPLEGGPITNQNRSGRCWLFAATNVFRVALMHKYGLDAFELSQAYVFFWDKLEKANWFLEQVLATAADHDLDSRLMQHMLREPLSDGGQFDMVKNLVAKYGLVPQALYPDSYNAMNSGTINSVIFTKLREYALVLRKLAKDDSASRVSALSSAKAKMMKEIHTILTLTLGPPPSPTEDFTWHFVDKKGVARRVRATPLAFAEDIYSKDFRVTAATVASMVSLVHDPRHPPLSLLTVDRLGNIVGGRGVTYINAPDMALLKGACIRMLRAGQPVFFGSDVGKFSDRASGVMDLDLIDYELGLNVSLLGMGKAARLRTGESAMTHAMVLTAVHLDDDGKPVRWRVQNSWGTSSGDHGWFVMSDRWMDEFVYQAVIDPAYVSQAVLDVLKKDPIVLPLWDPMGSLA